MLPILIQWLSAVLSAAPSLFGSVCLLLQLGLLWPLIVQADSTAVPSGIDHALEIIGRDAEYVSQHVPWNEHINTKRIHEFALALSGMNFVQSRVSSLQYGYRLKTDPGSLPTTVESCLVENAGICGNQIAVFLDLMTRLGLAARSVELYWETAEGQPVSHVGAEVMLGGKWRYFDVTWGTYFVAPVTANDHAQFYDRLLSFDEIGRLPDSRRTRIMNESALAFQLQLQHRIDPFDYLSVARTRLYGKTGTIRLIPKKEATGVRYRPENKPNYFGWVQDYSGPAYGHTSVLLDDPGKDALLKVVVEGAVCTDGMVRIRSEKKTSMVRMPGPSERSMEVPLQDVRGAMTLEAVASRAAEPCYVAFKEITVLPLRPSR